MQNYHSWRFSKVQKSVKDFFFSIKGFNNLQNIINQIVLFFFYFFNFLKRYVKFTEIEILHFLFLELHYLNKDMQCFTPCINM
jgi:hypothetical protein